MAEDTPILTERGVNIIRRSLVAILLTSLFVAGFWMLNQTLDAVVILGRGDVSTPFYPLPVSVWMYHDAAYALLWLSYVGFVAWDILPWKHGRHMALRVFIALLGFSIITAGLWLGQDTMNAVLVLHRTTVDYPFLVATLDVFESRDVSVLLAVFGFVAYYILNRVFLLVRHT